jgi:hypothetical protein
VDQAARLFYVIGFTGNCLRQSTAALAMFGTAELHEQFCYERPAGEYPSSTEKAKALPSSQSGRSEASGGDFLEQRKWTGSGS